MIVQVSNTNRIKRYSLLQCNSAQHSTAQSIAPSTAWQCAAAGRGTACQNAAQNSTACDSIAQHSTAWPSTAQHSMAQHSSACYNIADNQWRARLTALSSSSAMRLKMYSNTLGAKPLCMTGQRLQSSPWQWFPLMKLMRSWSSS